MTPESWEKVSHIFNEAVALRPDERKAFVEEACEGDETLRLEVMSLLSAHDEAGDDFIEKAAGETAALEVSEMPTLTGTLFSHYRIEKSVGRGGMGHIYLAADTRLDRSVALKKLPDRYAADPHFLKRFRTEARAAATLNHPNVATIYSVEDFEGTPFITMEYVEGKTLDAVTPAGGMELSQFLDLFIQISEALQHAHEKGITHRDIKPGNIVISTDGVPKILDFGLAQITEDSQKTIDSRKSTITQPGQIIGTPSYMSPEQAQGKEIDPRTDIFSLGVVMYEAITGVRPFRGENNAEIVSNLLKSEPRSVSEVRPDVPLLVARLIERCIQKRRRERPQSMQEIRTILGDAKTVIDTGVSTGSLGRRLYMETRSPGMGLRLGLAALILLLAGLGWFYFSSGKSESPIAFANMTVRRLSQTNNVFYAHITADGKSIVYETIEESRNPAVWIRRIDDRNALQLISPQPQQFWGGFTTSEDGSQIYYATAVRPARYATLYRISSLGGNPRKIVDKVNDVGSLSPDGRRILFVRHGFGEPNEIRSANAIDGGDEKIIRSDPAGLFRDPHFSPDGQTIYYIRYEKKDGVEYWCLVQMPSSGGEEKFILPFQKERLNSMAIPQTGGIILNAVDPQSKLDQLFYISLPSNERARITNDLNSYFGVSIDRTALNIVAAQRYDENRIWVGNLTNPKSLKQVTSETNINMYVEWTPDGRIVYDVLDNNRQHILISNSDGSNVQQLTPNDSNDTRPSISPDGRFVVFTSDRTGYNKVWRMDIDGSNQILLGPSEGVAAGPRFGPDGQSVLFDWQRGDSKLVGSIPLAGGETVELPPYSPTYWAISPDGKKVAFAIWDDKDQRSKIGIRPIDQNDAEVVLDISPVYILKWSADSKSLIYREWRTGEFPESTIFKWDIGASQPKALLSVQPDGILDISFSMDSKQLAVIRGKSNTDAVIFTNVVSAK